MSDTNGPAPGVGNVPFQEAIDTLRDKLRLTSRGWTDVWQEQNAVAFTVAGAQSAALVADLHEAVTRAIADGTTLDTFRKDFDAIVARHGWAFRGERGWRTRVIFETNMRASYMAGRWQQAEQLKAARPFLRYVAVMDSRTRPLHRAWHGTVLPIDHPWWTTHFPPNGWGCRCTIQSLSARDLARRGWKVSDPPRSPLVAHTVNTPDGPRQELVPEGIDPGWAYHVGAAAQHARAAQQAARDIGRMPADLGAVVGENIATATRRALAEDYRAWLSERTAEGAQPDGSYRAVGALPREAIDKLAELGQEPATAGVAITADQVAHIVRDVKAVAGKALPLEDLRFLPEILDNPEAVLLEKSTGNVLLVLTPSDAGEGRKGKLVIRLGFIRSLRQRDGTREKLRFNAVISGGLTDASTLRSATLYEVLSGSL